MPVNSQRSFGTCVILIAMSATISHAQITAVSLHPSGGNESIAFGTVGGQVGGYAILGGVSRASVWSGGAGSRIDLHPGVSGSSQVFATNGSQQVGGAVIGGGFHASIWNGSAASWIDLHPPGVTSSFVRDTNGTRQVGYTAIGGQLQACFWNGSASSWTSLATSQFEASEATSIDGSMVGGRRYFQAALWDLDSMTTISLNPAGASNSEVWDVKSGQQVGSAYFGSVQRACLWNGSAASFVQLGPNGSRPSVAWGTDGSRQVGWFMPGAIEHACMWTGTQQSVVDLHNYLPTQYTVSYARSIWTGGSLAYVCGYAYNQALGRTEAVMWTIPIPSAGTGLLAMLCAVAGVTRKR